MTARPVLVVGDIVTDIVAIHSAAIAVDTDTAASVSMTAGGSAANTAAWLAYLGVPVEMVGVTGNDSAGSDRTSELAASGVGCGFVRRTPDAPTGTVIVLVHAQTRTMLCDRGANLLLSTSDVDAAVSGTAAGHPHLSGHLHLSGYVLLDDASREAGRYALASARRHGLTTSVDAASAAPLRRVGAAAFLDWVQGTDLLLANLDEARALAGDGAGAAEPGALAQILTRSARHVVVKLGADGAVWAAPDGAVVAAPAQRASVVDPTGAGDAFAAGLLAAWLGGAGPAAALAGGARLGALAVTTVGGRPPGPCGRSQTPE